LAFCGFAWGLQLIDIVGYNLGFVGIRGLATRKDSCGSGVVFALCTVRAMEEVRSTSITIAPNEIRGLL